MTPRIYGIANCDSVKAARFWLKQRGIDAPFHDFRTQGLPEPRLDAWLEALGWEALLNRRGSTWRMLDAPIRARVADVRAARQLMLDHPSIVKRPVVEWGAAGSTGSACDISVGFDAVAWAARLPAD